MKISIITTSFNSEQTIEETILSVLNQTYSEIEYIIIDGGSTDKTLEIVQKYNNKIAVIISEKDNGIYDAMNKGIMCATGDIIGILNSDDLYNNNTVIETVVAEFQQKKVNCLWGDLVYVKRNDPKVVVRYWKSSSFYPKIFNRGWNPPHPTFFVRREIYEKYGMFRLDLSIAADYELMLRFLEKEKINSSYLPQVLVRMRRGGISNKNIFNIIRANIQCIRAFVVNRIFVNPLLVFIKPISKLSQRFLK